MKWKILLLTLLIGSSILGLFIGLPPIYLLGFYGIIAIIPWTVVLLERDLTNGILIWFALVLFSGATGEIDLPMLPNISFYRVIWIILFLMFLVKIAVGKIKPLPFTKIEVMMALFCFLCLISMIKAKTLIREEQGFGLRNFLNGYLIPFTMFFFAKNIVNEKKKIRKVFIFFMVIGIYLGITGIFEHFKINSLIFPRYITNPNVGIHWGRARGPFVQAAVNGTVLGMIFFMSIYLFLSFRKKYAKFFLMLGAFIMLITIFFTYTRACWLATLLSSVLVIVLSARLRKAFLLGLLGLTFIFVLTKFDTSARQTAMERLMSESPIYDRINLYRAVWRMFLERPIFGFGFDTFKEKSPQYFHKIEGIPYQGVGLAPHDTLAGILAELGLSGFILIFLIFLNIFRTSKKLYNSFSKFSLEKDFIVIFWAIFFTFIINIEFIEMRFFLFPNSLFFLLAGIMVGLYQKNLLEEKLGERCLH